MVPPPAGSDPANPPPPKFEVVGQKAGDSDTTVNGGTTGFIAEGVTAGIVIETGKGDDFITVANPPPPPPTTGQPPPPPAPPVAVPGGLRINAGDGNDRVGGSIANRGNASIVLGTGNDGLNLTASAFNNLQIFGEVPPPPPNTTPLPPPPPPGADRMLLDSVRVGGTALIDAGPGDDGLTIQSRSAFANGLNINMGDGNDGVQLLGLPAANGKPAVPVAIQGVLNLNLGGGNDKANLSIVNVGTANIDAGAGDDAVNIGGVHAVDTIYAVLGAGADKLTVGGSAAKHAKFYGGDGTDLFTNRGENTFGDLLVDGFEPPPAP
jgi:hypothetical protein